MDLKWLQETRGHVLSHSTQQAIGVMLEVGKTRTEAMAKLWLRLASGEALPSLYWTEFGRDASDMQRSSRNVSTLEPV